MPTAVERPGGQAVPAVTLNFGGFNLLNFAVIGVQSEVKGFSMTAAPELAAAPADHVSTKLQALYDELPAGEQAVLEAILTQAAAYTWCGHH